MFILAYHHKEPAKRMKVEQQRQLLTGYRDVHLTVGK